MGRVSCHNSHVTHAYDVVEGEMRHFDMLCTSWVTWEHVGSLARDARLVAIAAWVAWISAGIARFSYALSM